MDSKFNLCKFHVKINPKYMHLCKSLDINNQTKILVSVIRFLNAHTYSIPEYFVGLFQAFSFVTVTGQFFQYYLIAQFVKVA